jgi:hypothetical protein
MVYGMSARQRFDGFWQLDETTGCHLWTGSTTWGYGMFWCDGRQNRAHRWIVETERGPIPEGLVVDHLCRNRNCVNVEHLEVVTQQVNARRRSDATHGPLERGCMYGHPASEMVIYTYPYGIVRRCRICGNAAAEAQRRRDGYGVRHTRDDATCKHGHPWPEHLRIAPNGRGFCIECKRQFNKRQAAARKAARHQQVAMDDSTESR